MNARRYMTTSYESRIWCIFLINVKQNTFSYIIFVDPTILCSHNLMLFVIDCIILFFTGVSKRGAQRIWSIELMKRESKWPRMCSFCRNHNPVLSSFMTYHRVCNNRNTTGATCGAGTAYPSRAREFTRSICWGWCWLIISFLCNVLKIVVCPFVSFSFVHCGKIHACRHHFTEREFGSINLI